MLPSMGCRLVAGLALALLVILPSTDAAADEGRRAVDLLPVAGLVLAQADGIDGQVGGLVKGLIRELRRAWRTIIWMYRYAAKWWGWWLRHAAFPLCVAVVATLADAGLLNAFRLHGLRALVTYVPLMLFVYLRLLFSGGVSLLPKLVLLGTLIYGAVRRDLVPDRAVVPGRLEDILLIVVATRAFIYACPEALVAEYAQRAVSWRRRVASLQQRNG